jgi:hypothetical protein
MRLMLSVFFIFKSMSRVREILFFLKHPRSSPCTHSKNTLYISIPHIISESGVSACFENPRPHFHNIIIMREIIKI